MKRDSKNPFERALFEPDRRMLVTGPEPFDRRWLMRRLKRLEHWAWPPPWTPDLNMPEPHDSIWRAWHEEDPL